MMEVGWMMLKGKRKEGSCLFPEIMTKLLKIIHRPCCEQFCVGTIFFLPNYTCQLYHCREASFSNVFFWAVWVPSSYIIFERTNRHLYGRHFQNSATHIKQSKLINSTTGKRKYMYFWFLGELTIKETFFPVSYTPDWDVDWHCQWLNTVLTITVCTVVIIFRLKMDHISTCM